MLTKDIVEPKVDGKSGVVTQETSHHTQQTPPFRACLLDDNLHDTEHFRHLLRRHPAIQLVAEATSFRDALDMVVRERVDVLFLESEISDRFILEECHLIPASVKLIFLTQNQAAAVRAFELDAVDFLLKPLTTARLSETVRRLLRIDWQRSSHLAPLSPPSSTSGMILIPFERGRRGVSLDRISLIQAFGNYTRISVSEGHSEIVLRSLAKWEKLLPSPPFLRVHRNTMVNLKLVRGLEDTGNGSVLHMADDSEPISVSRRCLTEVRQALFKED